MGGEREGRAGKEEREGEERRRREGGGGKEHVNKDIYCITLAIDVNSGGETPMDSSTVTMVNT